MADDEYLDQLPEMAVLAESYGDDAWAKTLKPFDFVQEQGTLAAPPLGTPVNQRQLVASATAQERDLRETFYTAMAEFGKYTGTEYRVTGDRIQKWVPKSSLTGTTDFGLGPPVVGGGEQSGGSFVDVGPGHELQELYNRWKKQEQVSEDIDKDLKDKLYTLVGDSGSGGGGGRGGGGSGGYIDAAEAYLDAEQLKQKEITRQYNDFAARADELYQLLVAETQMNMQADDQNAQNAKLMADTGQIMPVYGHQTLGNNPLSEILRPSLPSYVRPDYRLNQAVGLPGEEGFDDPDYDENGFPMFAFGTAPWVRVNPRFRMRAPIGAAPWERR